MRLGHFLALVPLLAGCPGGGGECEQDYDCSGGELCANTHECLGAGELRRVDVHWTLYGQTPTTASCASIDRMELTVRDSITDASATWSPVPCDTGTFLFLALPTHYDSVAMSAFVGGSFAEADQATISDDGNAYLDFSQGTVVDAGMP
jgi:hypothetical protein